jgi:hypothetical protein
MHFAPMLVLSFGFEHDFTNSRNLVVDEANMHA